MKKLIILDYGSNPSVDVYDVEDKDDDVDLELLVSSSGHNPENCEWMYGDNIEIVFHRDVITSNPLEKLNLESII